MRHVNNLIPFVGSDFKQVFDSVINCNPTCLYTYETCRASYSHANLYVKNRENSIYNHDIINQVVNDIYGWTSMDNKITLEYSVPYDISEDGDLMEVPVFVTLWDGTITISDKVTFFHDVKEVDSSRKVLPYMPDGNEASGFEGYWYTDRNGNRCHTWDFEQSIGE